MPAWHVTKLWDAAEIANYRKYAAKEGPNKAAIAVKCTCEDLAIRIVSEYASINGLPAYFYNDSHPFPLGLTPDLYANLSEYLEKVLSTTGARDLKNYNTVELVNGTAKSDSNSLRRAQAGDIIAFNDSVSHVQVVVSASSAQVKIVQGNTHDPWGRNSSNPTSGNYVGVPVAEKNYVLDATSGKWIYDGRSEIFKEKNCRLTIWTFDNWNSRMISYTVKKGDNVYTIAQALYGHDAWRRSIYITSLLKALGANQLSPPEGMKLLLWR